MAIGNSAGKDGDSVRVFGEQYDNSFPRLVFNAPGFVDIA
jgi:hypothetical protein